MQAAAERQAKKPQRHTTYKPTMKKKSFFALLIGMAALAACDTSTEGIGSSMTDDLDRLTVETDTFIVTSRTVKAPKVIGRSTKGYLGMVRDPETGTYVKADFVTQFHTLEDYEFPTISHIISQQDGLPAADSCEIRLYFESYHGDSLATMKLSVIELGKTINDSDTYYTDFDPDEAGYLREDGLKIPKTYTICNLNYSEETREDDDYTPNIQIPLNQPYTDTDGVTYNNFGTYLMRKYYENPDYFKNSYNLAHSIMPGFYFKNESGLGTMACITAIQMNLFFRYTKETATTTDSVYLGTTSLAGTEEVVQTTRFTNNESGISRLLADNTCSYLKTPAGLYTELTLPVDEIMQGHENDTLNTAEIILPRINNDTQSKYAFGIPQTLLLVPSAESESFFENNEVIDYKTTFLATFGTSETNCYTFHNIGALITHLYLTGNRDDENWNKVTIIPVTTMTNSESAICQVNNDLTLASTRLVGGPENNHQEITINVVYSRFK